MAELPDGTPHSHPADRTRSKHPTLASPLGAVGDRVASAMRSSLGIASKAKVEPHEAQEQEHLKSCVWRRPHARRAATLSNLPTHAGAPHTETESRPALGALPLDETLLADPSASPPRLLYTSCASRA